MHFSRRFVRPQSIAVNASKWTSNVKVVSLERFWNERRETDPAAGESDDHDQRRVMAHSSAIIDMEYGNIPRSPTLPQRFRFRHFLLGDFAFNDDGERSDICLFFEQVQPSMQRPASQSLLCAFHFPMIELGAGCNTTPSICRPKWCA